LRPFVTARNSALGIDAQPAPREALMAVLDITAAMAGRIFAARDDSEYSLIDGSRPEYRLSGYVPKTAKARAQGSAALARYPLIADRLGQGLVSSGFEIKVGTTDKAKLIQTKNFAIHTLGHRHALATAPIQVGHRSATRLSGSVAGYPAVSRPSKVSD
jgi:hypothetical protein